MSEYSDDNIEDYSEEYSEPLKWGDYSSDEETKIDIPISFSVPIDHSYQVFFHWVEFSNKCNYKDVEEVILGYEFFCFSLAYHQKQMDEENVLPDYGYTKEMFKFRHNVFAAIFLNSIKVFRSTIDTDCFLSDYGIKTNKTPDYIIEEDNNLNLLEFTVSTKWENVLYTKGGGLLDIKYTKEINLLKESGYNANVTIIAAILGDDNISDIIDKARKFNPDLDVERMHELLTKFFRLSKTNLSIMNSLFSYHLSKDSFSNSEFKEASDFLEKQIESEFETFEFENDSFVFCFNADVISYLTSQREKMVRIIERAFIQRMKFDKLSLYLDLTSMRYNLKWRQDPHGFSPLNVIALLNEGSIGDLIGSISVEKSGHKIGFNEISGSVPVTMRQVYFKNEAKHPSLFNFNLPHNIFQSSDSSRFEKKSLTCNKTIVPPNYRRTLLANLDHKKLISGDKSNKMIISNPITDDHINESIQIFHESYSVLKFPEDSIHSPKPTFIYPLMTAEVEFFDYHERNTILCESLLGKGLGVYTEAILQKYLNGNFSSTKVYEIDEKDHELQQKMGRAHTDFYKFIKEYDIESPKVLIRSIKKGQIPEGWSDEKVNKILNLHSRIAELNQGYKKSIQNKIPLKTNLVSIRAGKDSTMRKSFNIEMEHFNNKKKLYKGIDPISVKGDEVNDMFLTTFMSLLNPIHPILRYNLFNTERKPDSKFMMELKNHIQEGWIKNKEELMKTPLFHSLYFIQKFCNTLFKESCKTYNSDYIHLDNLGIKNVILMVRGGPKIFTKQMSKLYRLIWPLDADFHRLTGYAENNNFKIVLISGINYVVTPWSQMNQDVIYDGMSIMSRFFSYFNSIMLHNEYSSISDLTPFDSLPVILGLCNRRKTEQFMHNMRYLIVNPIGTYSNIKDIIPTFAGFNYTYLDFFLRENLLKNYKNFATSIQRMNLLPRGKVNSILSSLDIKCIFTQQKISTSYQLVNIIYSTYLMTKAPVDSKLEQVNNLWPVLDDVNAYSELHNDVNFMQDSSLRFSLLDNNPEVYKDDFKYDPIFCQELGNFANGFLKRNVGALSLDNMWKGCINTSFDKMANSNGLRGWNDNNFFNKKGYEVVYEYINEIMEDDLQQVLSDYEFLDHSNTVENLNQNKLTFLKYYKLKLDRNEKILDKAKFHIVDKLQRGGGREIFVMDIFTKAVQFPIEKFLSKVCNKIPNEFISIPSNKRSSIIHSIFFEKKLGRWVKEICRWVLDCRRWAPHSIFQKYVHFIYGMKSVLPTGFYQQFMYLSKKMMEKEFIVKKPIVDSMKNNIRYEAYNHILKEQPKYYKMDVKFSFVMGIFNFLSSMLHAFNQMYASELIRDYNLNHKLGLTILRMNAHSDDSAGESQHEKKESIIPTITLYDWLLKGANHMLSIKKSQVNNNQYFEFLSVLYLKNELLPVSPKFIGSLPFKPSDNGYPSDLTYSISKSLEMYFNGCSINESFLMLKLSERYIQNLYQIDKPSNLAPQYFGSVDSLPIDYMIGGPLTETFKDIKYNRNVLGMARKLFEGLGLTEIDSDNVKWDMNARLPVSKIFEKKVVTPDYLKNSWFLENCKMNDPVLNIIWYTNKLKDRKYMASLINEPDSRRYSRIFGSFLNRYLIRIDGTKIPATEVYSALAALNFEQVEEDLVDNGIYKQLTGELNDYLNSFDGVTLENKTWYRSEKTAKPIFFSANYTEFGTLSNISPNEYTVYRHEPSMFRFFGRRVDMSNSFKLMDSILDGIGLGNLNPDDTFKIVSKITGRDNKRYNYINHLPTNYRSIQNHEGYAQCLIETIHPYYKFDITTIKQRGIDHKKNFDRRGIPDELYNVIRLKNAIRFFQIWEVDDLDIFKADLSESYEESLKGIDTDWTPFIYNEYNNDTILLDNYYLTLWTKEQTKFGRDWIGDGTLICNLPETPICFEIMNNSLTLITVLNDSLDFSKMSSWYISSIVDREIKVRNQLVQSDVVPHDKIVLGYSDRKKVWGIGNSINFDMIFEQTNVEDSPNFNILYEMVKFNYDKNGRDIVTFPNNKNLKIKKAWELDFDKLTDVSLFLDLQKIRNLRNDKVKEMCHSCAIDCFGKIPYVPETVKRNIAQTELYKTIYNYPRLQEIMSSEVGIEDSMIEIFLDRKNKEPDFEFPSKEDLIKISKNPWTGKLPASIQKYISLMGNKALTDDELLYIYNLLRNADTEDEDRIFSELKMIYGDTAAVQGLVLNIVKDTRILKMCVQMPKDGRICSIHEDIYNMCITLLTDGLSYSNLLDTILNSYKSQSKERESSVNMFKTIYARSIIESISQIAPTHAGLKCVEWAIGIVTEIFENASETIINNYRFHTDLLRTTDFFEDFDLTKGWLCDIFDSLTQVNWRILSFKTPTALSNRLTGFGNIAAEISKNKLWMDSKIEILVPGTNKSQTIGIGQQKPGPVIDQFKPLSEDDLDEFTANIGLEDNPEEFIEFIGDPEPVPWITLVRKNLRELDDVRKIRGSAWNVFCFTNCLTEAVMKAKNAVLYQKNNFRTMRDWVASENNYLVGFTYGKKSIKIKGFDLIDWHNIGKFLNYPKFDQPFIHLQEGKENKSIMFNDSSLMAKVDHQILSMWGRLKIEDYESFDKKTKRIVNLMDVKDNKENNKILNRIDYFRSLVNPESNVQPLTNEGLSEILGELLKTILSAENLKAIGEGEIGKKMEIRIMEKILRDRPSNFRVDKNISVINDIRIKSEMESLLPGITEGMLSGESLLTKKSKRQLIKIAENNIKLSNNTEEKNKLSRLLIVIKSMLGSIWETVNEKKEDTLLFRKIADLFFTEDEPNTGELIPLFNLPPEIESIDFIMDYETIM